MLKDLPPPSTLTAEEWDWEPDTIQNETGRLDDAKQHETIQRRVNRLEFALEAKQAELQSVIDHYELLLEDCQERPSEPESNQDGPLTRVVSTVTEHLSY